MGTRHLERLKNYVEQELQPRMRRELADTGTVARQLRADEMASRALHRCIEHAGSVLLHMASGFGEPLQLEDALIRDVAEESAAANLSLPRGLVIRNAALLQPRDWDALGYLLDAEEADAAHHQGNSWEFSLTPQQLTALRWHVRDRDSCFNALNAAADLANVVGTPTRFCAAMAPVGNELASAVGQLAIRPEYALHEGVLFRGITNDVNWRALRPGDTMPVQRPISATVVESAAYYNSDPRRPVALRILVDSGRHEPAAIDVSSFHTRRTLQRGDPHEAGVLGQGEHLLLPGQRLVVTGVTTRADGGLLIVAQLERGLAAPAWTMPDVGHDDPAPMDPRCLA